MALAEILKYYLNKSGDTAKNVAEELGVTRAAVTNWSNGIRNPKDAAQYNALADRMGVSVDKLLDDTFLEDHEIAELFSDDIKNKKWQLKRMKNLITINYYEDVEASAGYGVVNAEIKPLQVDVSPEFLENVLSIPHYGNIDVVKVRGDSMEPFVGDGERVVVEREVEPKNGDVVIANYNGDIYVKKFFKKPPKKYVKLSSMNSFYPDIELEGDEVDSLVIVGIVRAKFNLNIKLFS